MEGILARSAIGFAVSLIALTAYTIAFERSRHGAPPIWLGVVVVFAALVLKVSGAIFVVAGFIALTSQSGWMQSPNPYLVRFVLAMIGLLGIVVSLFAFGLFSNLIRHLFHMPMRRFTFQSLYRLRKHPASNQHQKPNHVHPKKSPWNLLLIVPAFAFMAVLTVGTVSLLQMLQSMRCPVSTFQFGSGNAASILQIIPVMFASIGFGFLIANGLVYAISGVRDFFDRDAHRRGAPDYWTSQRGLLKFSVLLAAAMLPISLLASLSQFCLSPEGLNYQRLPWTGLHHYEWRDVTGIRTRCEPGGRGNWRTSFFLTMQDGTDFDIMVWPRATIRAYPEIRRALQNIGYSFDATGVRAGCDVSYANLLTQHP